jgi:eukaryotic-like serine/threonine-protein kinase
VVGAPRKEVYGPFEVLERLGIGGMATVHRAIERGTEGFERVVALKRLLHHLAEDEEFVRAFVREAKLASLLRHVSIVQIYELGRVGPSYFISMEYIPGRDLRVILRQARRACGAPPIEVALALLNELLDALDYAHNQRGSDGRPLGIVHRDISPSNLLVSHTGHLKVIDFGIAKATHGHLMTRTGRVKGKLSYMAPEALSGRLDARSDLFSASVIAHELLTATPLFACKEDLQTIDRLQNMEPPPPSAKNPSCPPELDSIVLRGLAKDPDQRWRSAAEMRAAVVELASGRYRLATKRELCHWVEEAFEMQPPSRRRLPLTAPGTRAAEQRRGVGVEPDDELMDLVWGGSGPSSQQPVLLDEVPDVSGRTSSVQPLPSGRVGMESIDFMVEEEPTNDVLRPGDLGPLAGAGAPVYPGQGQRAATTDPGPVPTPVDIFSLSGTPAVNWPGAPERAQPRADWGPFSSSPTTGPQPNSGVVEESLHGARLAMGGMPGTASPATARRRPILPVLAAAVAVAGAGAAIAWAVSGRAENDSTRQAALAHKVGEPAPPPAVRALPDEAGAAGTQPAPAAAPDPMPTPGKDEDPAAEAAEAADPPPAEKADKPRATGGGADEGDDADEGAKTERARSQDSGKDDAEAEPRKRKRKRDADERIALRESSADDEKEESVDEEEPAEEEVEDSEPRVGITQPTRPSTPSADDSKTGKGSGTSEEIDAIEEPAPTQEPAPKPAPPRKPIVVTPDRVKRQSGTIPKLRFPPWEQAPAAITAKLCVDASGAVTNVTVLSKLSGGVRSAVVSGLKRWRYKPVVQAGQNVPACFATTFKVELQ